MSTKLVTKKVRGALVLTGYKGEQPSGDVVIPEGVVRISKAAFKGCNALTSVTLPNSLVKMGLDIFSDCYNLLAINVDEANPVFSSKHGLLLDKGGSTLLVVPRGVSSVVIPDGVNTIGARAFWNCRSLTSVVLPESVTKINNAAFLGCTSLTSLIILAPEVTFGKKVFKGCSQVKTLQLPKGVEWEELMKEHEPAEDGLISVEEFFWGDFDDMLLAGEIN